MSEPTSGSKQAPIEYVALSSYFNLNDANQNAAQRPIRETSTHGSDDSSQETTDAAQSEEARPLTNPAAPDRWAAAPSDAEVD